MSRSQYSQWYTTARWRRLRAAQLARQPLCAYCLKRGLYVEATIADHTEPHRGDLQKFWYGALNSLCASCHSSTKQREENGRPVLAIGVDGWPVDQAGAVRR